MKKYEFKSAAFRAIHESALALFRAGAIDKKEMARFDKRALVTKKKSR